MYIFQYLVSVLGDPHLAFESGAKCSLWSLLKGGWDQFLDMEYWMLWTVNLSGIREEEKKFWSEGRTVRQCHYSLNYRPPWLN